MFNPWFSVILAFEGCEVVTLRMLKIGLDGAGTWYEAHRRADKLLSGMLDNNPWGRQHVAANASRQVTARPRLVSEQELDRILQEGTGRLPPSHRQSG